MKITTQQRQAALEAAIQCVAEIERLVGDSRMITSPGGPFALDVLMQMAREEAPCSDCGNGFEEGWCDCFGA